MKAEGEVTLERAKELYLDCQLDRAFPLFVNLAMRGDGEAMYFLGEYYAQGYGHTKRDASRAMKWRKKGAAAGNVLAHLNLVYEIHGRDAERWRIASLFFPVIEKMAKEGDIFAQNELPDMYFFGIGVKRSVEMSVYWLEKAAERGFWRPLNKLGELYFYGDGVPKDIPRAKKYFEKAAAMGYGTAEANLAMLLGGEEKYNGTKVISLLRRGFAHGTPWQGDVADSIGTCVAAGDGVAEDEAGGFAWFQRSARLGSIHGMYHLSLFYEKGIGTPQNKEKAKYWTKKAADSGHIESMIRRGIDLRDEGKYEEAMEYFQKSAEKNHPDGEVWLASCYLFGIGTEVDREEGRKWLEKAAASGSEDAVQMLKEELGIEYGK